MNKKHLGCLLCSLVLAVSLSAQDLGPHDINGQGCLSCHTTANVDPSNVAATYRWGSLTATYATCGGGTLTVSSSLTDKDPSFHSAACLVCHNGLIAESGTMAGSTLVHDHPINVPYMPGGDGHWPGTVTSNGVSFAPSHFDMVYGRPIRFYVSAGTPYVECTSCHDPHHYSAAIVTINGQTFTKPTAHFVRGWYADGNPFSNSASQFCRSCHYGQSNEMAGLNAPTY